MAVEWATLGTSDSLGIEDEECYEVLNGHKIKKESAGRKKHSVLGEVLSECLRRWITLRNR